MKYWFSENKDIKLYQGDCLEIMDKLIELGVKVDCIAIDPPYKLTSGGRTTKRNIQFNTVDEDSLKNGEFFKIPKFKDWAKKCYDILNEDTHAYFMTNTKNLHSMLTELQNVGFKLHEILVWNKGMHTPQQYYLRNVEFILFMRKGKAKPINNMGTFSLININGIKGNKIHPSEKPNELMELFISNSTNEGDLVLDCFMGSSSTGVACKNLNRKFIGIELDEKYFDIAVDRIKGDE